MKTNALRASNPNLKRSPQFVRAASVTLAAFATITMLAASTVRADPVTFQFKTTIDASAVKGSKKAPLIATYTFDSGLTNYPNSTPDTFVSYGPIQISLQVGDQCVTAYCASEGCRNGIDITHFPPLGDGYSVGFDSGSTITGNLFGHEVVYFYFQLFQNGGTMFNSTDLPLSPSFASLAQFQQTSVLLIDRGEGGVTVNEFYLHIFEDANSPPEVTTPFSLNLVIAGDASTLIGQLQSHVLSLHLAKGTESTLVSDLSAALQALAGGGQNSAKVAANNLQLFINDVKAQRGKKISATDADALTSEAQNIRVVLSLGC